MPCESSPLVTNSPLFVTVEPVPVTRILVDEGRKVVTVPVLITWLLVPNVAMPVAAKPLIVIVPWFSTTASAPVATTPTAAAAGTNITPPCSTTPLSPGFNIDLPEPKTSPFVTVKLWANIGPVDAIIAMIETAPDNILIVSVEPCFEQDI